MPEYHHPCEDCGSSDALTIYDDHKFCFACPEDKAWKPLGDGDTRPQEAPSVSKSSFQVQVGHFRDMSDRKISKATCEKYGVTVSTASDGTVSQHHYPWYTEEGDVCATKTRKCDTKDFTVKGTSSGALLFGQQTCRGRGKFITICEGEVDMLSVAEMFGRKYDVVSVRNGSAGAKKELQEQLEFLEGYDSIVLCFDNDKAGRKAVEECQDLFEPGKVRIVKTTGKDANAMLMQGQSSQFLDDWWGATEYTPAGIVRGDETWDSIIAFNKEETIEWPWKGLQEMTKGIVTPSLVTLTSGSGMGKSQLLREIEYYLLHKTTDNLGIIPLEETVARASLGLMSIDADRLFHLEDDVPEDTLRKHWEATLGTGRVFLLDHFGSTSVDSIVARVRYLAKAHECKFVFLDHLSIVVSAQETGDERKAIDAIMTRLRKLCEECQITLFLVSHLSRAQGVIHEEGGRVTLGQLRGSQAIAQLSDLVLACERNQQHEDLEIRNTTLVRIIKNRRTGETGPAFYLRYSRDTGRLTECEKPLEEIEGEGPEDF